MSSLVMEIEDYDLPEGQPVAVSRRATYFLLMTGSGVDVEFSYKGSRIGGGKGLQGGDAVGPLSQAYDQVTLSSATAQTVKIATSSDPVTITRLSGVVKVDGVVQTAPDYERVIRGKSFFVNLTQQAVAGEFSWIQLWNPATATTNLVIPALAVKAGSNEASFVLTNVEGTAANLNGFLSNKADCMLSKSQPVQSESEYVRRGTEATGEVLFPTTGGGASPIGLGWMDLKQPFVLAPGGGLAVRSRLANGEVGITAQVFEEEML